MDTDARQDQPWLLFSTCSGFVAAIASFTKAVQMTGASGTRAKMATYPLLIALLAVGFCFFGLLVQLWSSTAEETALSQNKPSWSRILQIAWMLQLFVFGGTALAVFLGFEVGSISLQWRYSSSLAFLFGLGQVGFFALYARSITRSVQGPADLTQ